MSIELDVTGYGETTTQARRDAVHIGRELTTNDPLYRWEPLHLDEKYETTYTSKMEIRVHCTVTFVGYERKEVNK